MSNLMSKMLKSGSIKLASVLNESAFFGAKEFVKTNIPIINIAFSGDLNGGIVPGLTTIAGPSKSFKTLLCLLSMKAYLDKYPEAIAIIYDSEFSITPTYIKSQGIDPERVLHIPVEHIEQLKFDMVKRLQDIEKGDKVFIMLDSAGAIASKKEIEDALEDKSAADMTRSKALKSWCRIITPHLAMKEIPCFVVQHTYKTMELYSKDVVSGGTGLYYHSNQIFIISKAQEKDSSGDLEGFKFTMNAEKSRFVTEKSKFPFVVTFEDGVKKYSGILDIALESGDVIKPSKGWYSLVDTETGEVFDQKVREKDTETEAFLGAVLKRPKFQQYIRDTYQLGVNDRPSEDNFEDLADEE